MLSPVQSYGVEVKWCRDDHDTIWTGDAQRFATAEEAHAYGRYLLQITEDLYTFRVCSSGLAPNATWGRR